MSSIKWGADYLRRGVTAGSIGWGGRGITQWGASRNTSRNLASPGLVLPIDIFRIFPERSMMLTPHRYTSFSSKMSILDILHNMQPDTGWYMTILMNSRYLSSGNREARFRASLLRS